MSFAIESSRVAAVLSRHCGNDYLARLVREQAHESLWGLIWCSRPLDFLTPERRADAAAEWVAVE